MEEEIPDNNLSSIRTLKIPRIIFYGNEIIEPLHKTSPKLFRRCTNHMRYDDKYTVLLLVKILPDIEKVKILFDRFALWRIIIWYFTEEQQYAIDVRGTRSIYIPKKLAEQLLAHRYLFTYAECSRCLGGAWNINTPFS